MQQMREEMARKELELAQQTATQAATLAAKEAEIAAKVRMSFQGI